MSYAIDQTGVELIASFEGFVNGVYNDSRGFATCGFGHLLHTSPATQQDHRTYDGKGRAFFEGLLRDDIERVAMKPMRAAIKVPLNQNRVNALACLAFNTGPGSLYGTVGRKVNARDWRGAQAAFMLWANPPVLRARREQEAALFGRPAKTKTPLPWLEPDERRWCLEYDRLLNAHKDKDRREVLRRTMRKRVLEIRHAAHTEGGWETNHRRQRFHSLNARSS